MKRFLVLTTAVAVAVAAPAGAATHDKGAHRAKVQRATLAPVAPYGLGSGKAQMTANKRNAKVSLHVKGLTPNTAYDWAVLEGDCATGTPVTGLTYKPLKTGDSGNGSAKASSKKNAFAFDKTATYSVVVYNAGTTDQVLCGTFKSKSKAKKPSKGKAKGHSKP